MSQSGFVFLTDVEVVHTTDAAVLILYNGDKVWIPKSQVAPDDRRMVGGLVAGDVVTLAVTEWIAEQKGLR